MARNPPALAPDSPSLSVSRSCHKRLRNPLITLPHIKSYKLITNDWGHVRNKYKINIINLILSEREERKREREKLNTVSQKLKLWIAGMEVGWIKRWMSSLLTRNECDNKSRHDVRKKKRERELSTCYRWHKGCFCLYSLFLFGCYSGSCLGGEKCFIDVAICILKAKGKLLLSNQHSFIHNIFCHGLRAIQSAVHLNDSWKCWTLIQNVMPPMLRVRFIGESNFTSNQWSICMWEWNVVKISSTGSAVSFKKWYVTLLRGLWLGCIKKL